MSIQVIYKDPFGPELLHRLKQNNRESATWDCALDDKVMEFALNNELTLRRDELLEQFKNSRDALLHGDLHTGSIMVQVTLDQQSKVNDSFDTKIFDAEFTLVGPIEFDIGVLMANFIVSIIVHWDSNNKYSLWMLNELTELWNTVNLLQVQLNFPKEMKYYLRDILGQAGIEIFRRILGIAHLEDLTSLNTQVKNEKEIQALDIALKFLLLPANEIHDSLATPIEIITKVLR